MQSGPGPSVQEHDSSFREHLPNLNTPRFQSMQAKKDAREYAQDFKDNRGPPWLHALYMHWMKLFEEPFTGITNDGMPMPRSRHLHSTK